VWQNWSWKEYSEEISDEQLAVLGGTLLPYRYQATSRGASSRCPRDLFSSDLTGERPLVSGVDPVTWRLSSAYVTRDPTENVLLDRTTN
jgi:hypothetical protein